MRYVAFRERKVKKFLFHCLNSEFDGPVVGTDIFVDRLRASSSKPVASWVMGSTANDHLVNGGATSAMAVVSTTLGM
jgi:hypothetical protein